MNSNLPKEVFSDPDFLRDISFLEDVEESTTSLSIAAQPVPNLRNYGDPVNKYELNTLGYRGPEFKKVPVIFAGCSITFGVGVPYDGIWSTILGEKLGLDCVNLSVPGWSTQAIVDNLFKYFYKYGNPETLFVVFPDYSRLILTSNRDFCTVGGYNTDPRLIKVQHAVLSGTAIEDRPKYSKKPHEFTDFITNEYALLQTFRSINALISYCKGSNIKLVWSTWDIETNEIINIVKDTLNKNSYSGYTFADSSFSGVPIINQERDYNYSGCHEEYVSRYGENFFYGKDGILYDNNSEYRSHPGVHYHMHLAEAMLEKFESIK
jgi:hypothetical protein